MPTKRLMPSGKWEFVVKNKKMLGNKPWYSRWDSEAEGTEFCTQLENMLKQGIMPKFLLELRAGNEAQVKHKLTEVVELWAKQSHAKQCDIDNVRVLVSRVPDIDVVKIDYTWVKEVLQDMKRNRNLSPSTIKHQIGALARCFDWVKQENCVEMATNPVRMLPRSYAGYTAADAEHLQEKGLTVRFDHARDRRLEPHEEPKIWAVLHRQDMPGVRQSLTLKYRPALICIFTQALEIGMRMSEIYTLRRSQIQLDQNSIVLEFTKNGTSRVIPITSPMRQAWLTYFSAVESGDPEMMGFQFSGHGDPKREGLVFPYWSGETDYDGSPSEQSIRETTSRLSRQFYSIFEAAGLVNFRFHDLRHEATSRLFERTRLTDIEIAKITGHKSLKMLLRYTKLRPSMMTEKLW